jgi:hypothetical protein
MHEPRPNSFEAGAKAMAEACDEVTDLMLSNFWTPHDMKIWLQSAMKGIADGSVNHVTGVIPRIIHENKAKDFTTSNPSV